VESADSAERALARLSVAMPQLVITDLRMSGMDGMALFENIHKSNPTLPVIILTAHGTIPDAVAATQRGVFGYLTKPFDSKELLQQVEKAVSVSGGRTEQADGETEWRTEIITAAWRWKAFSAKPSWLRQVMPVCWCAAKVERARNCSHGRYTRRAAGCETICRDQLRRHSRAIARIRIVRSHERLLHGRRARLQRIVPGRRGRHGVSR
jgi:CheY-like chemotaxis protein